MNKNKKKEEKKVGLIFFPAFDWAISPDHPEREERLLYTRDQIFEEGLLDLPQIEEYNPVIAEEKDVQRVHFCVPDVKTRVSEPHLISAGGAIKAAEIVLNGEVHKSFAIVRPPGHHAFRMVRGARGFCTINNEAIMVEWIRKNYGKNLKIAIIDTDAHHADGTQEIFYHDPDILHISLHQDGRTLFPGTGFVEEAGGPSAYGNTLNVPLPPYTTDEGIHYVIDNLVLPVLDEFKPDLIINDAGQDNHYSDPLTHMRASASGYALLTKKLQPDIVILQGGYSIEAALPYVNVGLILALAGMDTSYLQEPDYRPLKQSREITENIKRTTQKAYEIWQSRHNNKEEIFSPVFLELNGKKKKFYIREKNIFYDTDGIFEVQKEKIRWHEKCPGYLTIDSASRSHGNNPRVFSVHIPLNACPQCKDDALYEFEKALKLIDISYDLVQLQDLSEDRFICYPLNKKLKS